MLSQAKVQKNSAEISKSDVFNLFINMLSFFIGRLIIFRTLNPLAIGFLSNYLFSGKFFYVTCFCTFLGFATKSSQVYFTKYLFNLMILLLVNITLSGKIKKATILFKALTASVSSLAAGLIYAGIHSFSLYFTVVAILEAILTFLTTYLLKNGTDLFKLNMSKKVITSEEILSMSIIIGGVIAGSADLYIGNISLMYFFLSITLIAISYKGGISLGATSAILLGSILVISKQSTIDIIIVLSIASICGGALKNLSKPFTPIGFILGGILTTYYLNASFMKIETFYSAIIAGLIFLLIPDKFYITSKNTIVTNIDYTQDYINRIKEVTENKLNCFARSFYSLARTFNVISEKKTTLDQKDISHLIDDIAANVCSKCDMKHFCWESDFYNTYQTVFGILASCENSNKKQADVIPEEFINKCIDVERFIAATNNLFEIYKLNLMWKNKIIESRELISQQISGIADIVEKLSVDLSTELNFNDNINKDLINELNKNKISYKSAIVHKTNNNKYEVLITHNSCCGKKSCSNDIIPIVNNLLDRNMTKACYDCITTNSNGKSVCKLKLVEEKKYRINTAVASCAKSNGDSGDSHSFMELEGGNYLLALSDGMGFGEKAKRESCASIELFEDFITAGFNKDIAIKMINSVLVLKSFEESFSTLDICTINLYTGVCEFVKIGAAATFIVRRNKVSVISSNTLPVGILNEVDIQSCKKRLIDSDIIVMVTDGILDCVPTNKENWLKKLLTDYESTSPKEIADYILNAAKESQNGKINDDMTVIVARLWESF